MKAETYIRVASDEDISFVYDSWRRSLRPQLSAIDDKTYFKHQRRLIENIGKNATVIVSSNPECLWQIFGYAIFEHYGDGVYILHYIYVKHPYRRLGIANQIYRVIKNNTDLPLIATHYTRMYNILAPKWGLVLNPYLLLERRYNETQSN